ncbi:late competence development ComFB family protein [Lacrimispora xylanisolvens]|uniref:late competence development ComFB family protein n=1 Tax=Lacrimispora xylanisolvens TaxID=384636 RepID=UPI002402B8C2
MARKSSKTAHVMNLLAGGEAESSKSEAAKENLAASQAAESKGTIKELTVLAQQASIQMQDSPLSPSPISIIDLSSSVQDPVAELIKQQLEEDEKKELGTEFSEKNEDNLLQASLPDPISDNEINHVEESTSTDFEEVPVTEQFSELFDISPDVIDGTDEQDSDNRNESSISDVNEQDEMDILSISETDQADIQDIDESEQSDIAASDESPQSDNQFSDETAEPNNSVFDELTETDQIPDELKHDIPDFNEPIQPDIQDSIESIAPPIQTEDIPAKPEPPVTDIPATPKASNFKYLNVMEHVVENIARDYIGRLGGCTCEHCIADVTALTLNKLTPKYVVVEPPAASPLLNFYSSRFAPQVIVELTKSCFIVKENPHH